MGTIYSAPEGINPPSYSLEYSIYSEKCSEYIKKIIEWTKKSSKEIEAGEEIMFNVADGYARYIVLSLKPVKLIHLDIDDAYAFEYVHRLTASDIRKIIEKQKRFDEIFKEEK